MAPKLIEFFPYESVLYDGLNILAVNETVIIVKIRAEGEPTFKACVFYFLSNLYFFHQMIAL